MILGMSTSTLTVVHVVLSLTGMATGAVVVLGLSGARRLNYWTAIFLVTTVATSATGFLFHSARFGAAHVVGVISLAVLALAILALYVHRLAGPWRWVYVASSMLALYLNVFGGVVQAFQKLPFLRAFAPTGSEPPFVDAQALVAAIFIALGTKAVKRFHPGRKRSVEGQGMCYLRSERLLRGQTSADSTLCARTCGGRAQASSHPARSVDDSVPGGYRLPGNGHHALTSE